MEVVCFELHEQFFSYLATVTIQTYATAFAAFGSEVLFHTYCDNGPPFLRSYPKDPSFKFPNAVHLYGDLTITD
jgi:hypothetical protein